MKTKKAANGILTVFLTVMILFTLFGDALYRLTLPKVVTERLIRTAFPVTVTGMDGTTIKTQRIAYAILQEALNENEVYVLKETEEGTFLEKRQVKTGEILDEWIEVTDGLSGKANVVIGSDRELKDGSPVIATEWNEQIAVHMARERGENNPEASSYIRKGLQRNVVYLVLVTIATVFFALLCKKVMRKRWKLFYMPFIILWCVLVCFFLKEHILIPGEWIPDKLIDWNGWIENMKMFPL